MSGSKPAASPKSKKRQALADQLGHAAWELAQSGDLEQAVTLLEMATELRPQQAWLWIALGITHVKAAHQGPAIAAFERALAHEDNIETWCMLGEAAITKLDFPRAYQAFKRCLELDPDAKNPAGVRARALIRRTQKQLSGTPS